MKNLLRRNPAASAETELKNLAARRETLETRKGNAIATLEAARSARKNALASDPNAELSGLTRAVREGEDELETLTGVLADLVEEVAAAEARLADARDADVRAAAAKTLEGVAVSVDTAAAELERGLAIVGKAYAALVGAIPETLNVVQLDERVVPPERSERIQPDGVFALETYRQTALPNDLARAVLAEGIARVCPMAFGQDRRAGFYHLVLSRAEKLGSERPSFKVDGIEAMGRTQTAREAATALISGRLRDRAGHIVAGDMSPNLEDEPIFRPKPKPVAIPEVEVYALENFAFQTEAGKLSTLIGKWWAHRIPQDAALAAVAAKVGLLTSSPEGAAAFAERKQARLRSPNSMGGTFLSKEMCVDLGLVRKAVKDADDNVVGLDGKAVAA